MKKTSVLLFVLLLGFMVNGFWLATLSAQDGTVRVTAARANIRSEPNDKARKPAYKLWLDFGPLGLAGMVSPDRLEGANIGTHHSIFLL